MKNQQHMYLYFLLPLIFIGINSTWADNGTENADDYNESYENHSVKEQTKPNKKPPQPHIAPVNNQTYIDNCGSCHFPFQPGLLPANAWERLIIGLAHHFGDNAELPEDERKQIRSYLVNHSLEKSSHTLPKKIMDFTFSNNDSLRITENIYIVYEHRSIPKKMVHDNPKVRSLSRCDVCHLNAKEGFYTESNVWIPGFGSWKVKVMH